MKTIDTLDQTLCRLSDFKVWKVHFSGCRSNTSVGSSSFLTLCNIPRMHVTFDMNLINGCAGAINNARCINRGVDHYTADRSFQMPNVNAGSSYSAANSDSEV